MAELYLARRLKLVGVGWILLGQDIVPTKSADATLDGYLSFGIFGLGLARGAGIAILRQEEAAQKQQNDAGIFHGNISSRSMGWQHYCTGWPQSLEQTKSYLT
jgi:hypothetical protein